MVVRETYSLFEEKTKVLFRFTVEISTLCIVGEATCCSNGGDHMLTKSLPWLSRDKVVTPPG